MAIACGTVPTSLGRVNQRGHNYVFSSLRGLRHRRTQKFRSPSAENQFTSSVLLYVHRDHKDSHGLPLPEREGRERGREREGEREREREREEGDREGGETERGRERGGDREREKKSEENRNKNRKERETETPRTAASTFTHLLSSVSLHCVQVQCSRDERVSG